MEITPARLKKKRLRLNLTYRDVARMAGVTVDSIRNYEQQRTKTLYTTLAKIANALGFEATPEKVYMMISQDDLSLPMAIADTLDELCELVGIEKSTLAPEISRCKNREYPKYIVVKL